MSVTDSDERGSLVFKQSEMKINEKAGAELIDYLDGIRKQTKIILRSIKSLEIHLQEWGSPDDRLEFITGKGKKVLQDMNHLCFLLRHTDAICFLKRDLD